MASFIQDNSILFKKEQAIIAKLFIKSPHMFFTWAHKPYTHSTKSLKFQ